MLLCGARRTKGKEEKGTWISKSRSKKKEEGKKVAVGASTSGTLLRKENVWIRRRTTATKNQIIRDYKPRRAQKRRNTSIRSKQTQHWRESPPGERVGETGSSTNHKRTGREFNLNSSSYLTGGKEIKLDRKTCVPTKTADKGGIRVRR